MALLVQKFGGTSVGNLELISWVADKIVKTQSQGHQVVVVVSAMAGETNRLDALAHQLAETPLARELDVLLSTGEQVCIALLAIALHQRGCKAQSFTASQIPILTSQDFNKARIKKIETQKIKTCLQLGKVAIIAGFQGVDKNGNITTLGRGGSDTTAVALAAALKADECQIYTDVEGVYTTDPRVVPYARLLERITFEEMLELSSLGAKVLQIRAVEFAGRFNVPLRVLSTFKEGLGTLISYEDKEVGPIISGIAFSREEAKFVLKGIPDIPGVAARILEPISLAQIEVDMIVQNMAESGFTDFAFTVYRKDFNKTCKIVEEIAQDLNASQLLKDDRIAKLSLVGVGMRSHAGIASKMFKALGEEGINIQLISTSEIKVSVVMDEKYLELGVRTLHEAFQLEKEYKGLKDNQSE
ncbi:MAG: lysC [Francisellaceae bacterium]|nr:lysC [Francisellaceae bacterium]